MRLTDLQIRKLGSPQKGQKTYFDDNVPGFGVRTSQGGTKTFVIMYGKDRQLRTLGRYPELGLAEARKQAKKLLGDFAILSPAVSSTPTISFAMGKEKFLASSDARNKPSTAGEYRRLLNRHFQYDKALTEISRQDVMAAVEQLRKSPSEQKHAFVAIRTMMNWCHTHGLIEFSPVPRWSFSTEPRSRVLTDTELNTVWHSAEEFEYPYGRIVQLLILTGQRRGEIAGLRRSWIQDDMIVFPIGFTKNKREHRLPLAPKAKAIIDALPANTDLLFPARGQSEAPFSGWSKTKRQFDRSLQIAPYVLHDLRRTFSSNLARLGVPIHVTEKLLNHVSGTVSGVAAVYNRYSYLDEMREALDHYEGELFRLTESTTVNL